MRGRSEWRSSQTCTGLSENCFLETDGVIAQCEKRVAAATNAIVAQLDQNWIFFFFSPLESFFSNFFFLQLHSMMSRQKPHKNAWGDIESNFVCILSLNVFLRLLSYLSCSSQIVEGKTKGGGGVVAGLHLFCWGLVVAFNTVDTQHKLKERFRASYSVGP